MTDLNSVTVPGIPDYLSFFEVSQTYLFFPGAAAAWLDSIDKFGSGKLSPAEIFEPAIRLAEDGVPVSEINSIAVRRWILVGIHSELICSH